MGKLIFIDIDGTLTVAGENIPPSSAVEAIKMAQKKGHKVFLSTGRNIGMLSPLLKYGFDGVIGCGGGIILVDGKLIYDCPMSDDQRDIALEVLARNGVFRTIEAYDVTYGDENLSDFLDNTDSNNSEIERWRKSLASELGIRPMSEYDGRPIYKIVVMCNKSFQLDEARKLLGKDFNFAIQDVEAFNCLNGDLVNRKFDKGKGIIRVCEELNVDIKDTVAFGDSMNDLEMLEVAGISVVMGNGSEKLKAKADFVADRVDNDGLYKAFKKLELI